MGEIYKKNPSEREDFENKNKKKKWLWCTRSAFTLGFHDLWMKIDNLCERSGSRPNIRYNIYKRFRA